MSKTLAQISIVVGGLATTAACLFTSQFFFVARGATVFPLGWMIWMMLFSGFALLFGAGPAIYASLIPPRRLAIIGLLLSLSPAPVALLLFSIASAACGFNLGG